MDKFMKTMMNISVGPARGRRAGFTLIELLVVIGIIALLLSILLPALEGARAAGKRVVCAVHMRQFGMATLMYAEDNKEWLPHSSHSAMRTQCLPWGYALCPYLNGPADPTNPDHEDQWKLIFNGFYRCPADRRKDQWSYGKSVYSELTLEEFPGPLCGRMMQIRHPAAVIFYGELKSDALGMADHMMCHFWDSGGAIEVDRERHGNTGNYAFLDGRVQNLKFEETWDKDKNLNNWNPNTAR
jgi:prepilin-type N-terminal cleavage/methylation domain-containing protein/prepilin-type processing-associated H-X9-DG protein